MPLKSTTERSNHNYLGWCKLVFAALAPCIMGIFTIVFTLQQQSLSERQRIQEQVNQIEAQRQTLFDSYIDDISKLLLQTSELNKSDGNFLLYVRTKTLNALRNLNAERKKHILLFLYESRLLQSPALDLRGADLNDVQLIGPYELDRLHLPGVFWSNALFIDCSLTYAVFNQSYMTNARFINSTLQWASLPETRLDHAHFLRTIVLFVNFTGSFLIRANFLDAEVVQGISFTNADLLGARFTEDQLQGKRTYVSTHAFHQARFPNGSFGRVVSRTNLIQNGDAESKCSTAARGPWLLNDEREDLSVIKSTIGHSWGKCMFRMRNKGRAFQDIDLRPYSLLIDNEKAMFSSAAYFGCNVSGSVAYIRLTIHQSGGIVQGPHLFLNFTEEVKNGNVPMHQYVIKEHRIMPHIRKARISFAVEPTQKVALFCDFDNMAFTIQEYISI